MLFLQTKIDALKQGQAEVQERGVVAKLLDALVRKLDDLGDTAAANQYRTLQTEFLQNGTISQEMLNRSLAASSRAESVVTRFTSTSDRARPASAIPASTQPNCWRTKPGSAGPIRITPSQSRPASVHMRRWDAARCRGARSRSSDRKYFSASSTSATLAGRAPIP